MAQQIFLMLVDINIVTYDWTKDLRSEQRMQQKDHFPLEIIKIIWAVHVI